MVDDRLVTMQIWDTAGQVRDILNKNCELLANSPNQPKAKKIGLKTSYPLFLPNRNAFNLWVLLSIEEQIVVY